MPTESSKIESTATLPDLNRLAAALSHPARWLILKELAGGEPRMVIELAEAAKCSADMASKHLAKLQAAGLVAQGRGRLYQIPKHYLSVPGKPHVDYGHCLLRMDATE